MVSSEHSAGPRPSRGKEVPELTPAAPLHPHLTELQNLLLVDRARSSDQVAALTQDFSAMLEATRLAVTDDEHDPEGSTITFERSRASALLAAADNHLTEVDLALGKVAKGSYGLCERCDQPIAYERLQARPAARTCVACAS